MTLPVDENGRYPVVRTPPVTGRQLLDSTRRLVLRRDHYRCVFCGRAGLLEVDHIIPWSAGGSDDPDNLRTLCRHCNQDRSNFRVPADDCRRIPNGYECVYCTPNLIGERLTAIYCIQCDKKAAGLPKDSTWHPDVDAPVEISSQSEYWERRDDTDLDELVDKQRSAALTTIRKALAAVPADTHQRPVSDSALRDLRQTDQNV